jgi:hypothetical protein
LSTAESEACAGEVSSDDLDPVGWGFSFAVDFNFIVGLSVGLDIKVVKVGFFTSGVSHDFVED